MPTRNSDRLDPARIRLVFLLLLAGLALRLVYAYGLPLDMDEKILLDGARKVSILPGHFNLPLVGPAARHPGFIVWLIAAADWLARGSLFGTRCFFVLLHIGGLLGLFLAARHLFGFRAGVWALAFGALDRFWIVSSAQLLEPSSFFLTPWILLAAYRCVYSPWRGRAFASWFVLGILLAVANFYYELFILLTFAVGVLLIVSPEGRKALRAPGPYVAAALALGIVVFIQAWNLKNHQGTLRYAAGVFGTRSLVALSPRILLLYLSDVVIPFRDASILALNISGDFYAPFHTPCDWAAGLFYLVSVACGFRFWRERPVAFLLVCFFCVAVPPSLVPPKELWSNIHYGGQSVVVSMILSGWIAGRLLGRRAGRAVLALLFAWLAVSIALFLRGPKWSYPGPDREMRFVGEVYYCAYRHVWSGNGPTDEDGRAIRRLIGDMARKRPDSLVVQRIRSQNALDEAEKLDAMRQAKRIDPHSPVTALLESARMDDAGNLTGARDCLKAALERRPGMPVLLLALAEVEYRLREYAAAAQHAEEVLKERPDESEFYSLLYFIYDAKGDTEAAGRAFESFRYWCRFLPHETYLWFAEECVRQEKYAKAVPFAEEALRLDPQFARAKFYLAVALDELGQIDRAEKLFREVPPSDETYPNAQAFLERIGIAKRRPRP